MSNVNTIGIEGLGSPTYSPENDARSSDSKIYAASIHENIPPTNRPNPTSNAQDDAGSSETPTIWMWVLTLVAGISGVGAS